VGRHLGLASMMVIGIDLAFRLVGLLVRVRPVTEAPRLLVRLAEALPFVGSWAFLLTMSMLASILLLVEGGRLLLRR
jgi:hypothetical protein